MDLKKFFSGVFVFLLLSGFVVAQHGMAFAVFENDVEVKGLNVALLQVENEESRNVLENNMEMIRERLRVSDEKGFEKIEEMENGHFEMTYEKRMKFLGFIPVDLTEVAEVDAEGYVVREKHTLLWYLSAE